MDYRTRIPPPLAKVVPGALLVGKCRVADRQMVTIAPNNKASPIDCALFAIAWPIPMGVGF